MEHYKDHGVSYLIDIPGAKYSHAIYTSQFTGQLPTNYAGKPIEGDHLVRSLLRANEDVMKVKTTDNGDLWNAICNIID
jgi:hypothetical protein